MQLAISRLTISLHPPVIEPPILTIRVDLPPGPWLWRTAILDLSYWGWNRWWWPRPTEPIVRAYHAGPLMLRCGSHAAHR